MSIISWNVLLRDYEEKYNKGSSILKDWPIEEERENAIVELLRRICDNNSIITLQEVSTSLLHKLIVKFPEKHGYVQKVRNNEFLVTMTPSPFVQEKHTNHTTSANAYLTIHNDYVRIVNTHLLPQRYAKCNVMEHLLNMSVAKQTIIAGDFNESWKNVNKSLGTRYTVPKFGKTYKNTAIDQIIFDFKQKFRSVKIPTHLSDHHMIKLNLL